MHPTIVVVAYNRPHSLIRLLDSLQTAVYPVERPVRLVISIDGDGEFNSDVREVANTAVWPYGPKELVCHDTNLGLIDHIFSCGDLSQRYGSIILLEDDLVVSPQFYGYACQALDFYEHDSQIAGISLNALWFNGFTQLPFTPYLDEGDAFFMQVAWFQGQAYTAAQWADFRAWYDAAGKGGYRHVTAADGMHPAFTRFAPTEWFPIKTKYLVQSGRFYLFPRESLSVNFGDIGTHFAKKSSFFQLPLQTRRRHFRFQPLADSVAVYDSFQEMVPDRVVRLAPHLSEYQFAVDFYGERPTQGGSEEYLLTTQPSARPILSYGLVMRPPVANVAHQIEGCDIVLTRAADIELGYLSRLRAERSRFKYYSRLRPMGWRRWLKLAWLVLMA